MTVSQGYHEDEHSARCPVFCQGLLSDPQPQLHSAGQIKPGAERGSVPGSSSCLLPDVPPGLVPFSVIFSSLSSGLSCAISFKTL